MSDVRDKLDRLKDTLGLTTGAELRKKQEQQPQPPRAARALRAPRAPSAPPSAFKDKLRNLLDQRDVMTGAQLREDHERIEERRAAGDLEVDQCVPGEVVGEEGNAFYLVRHDFPLDTRQGGLELGAVFESSPEHIALSACDAQLEAFDPATALFVDAETSGLAGGAGTIAFLMGVGYFTEGVFRLEQCFMRDFDDEEPMLHYLDGLFARGETVVSFNGKSFDMPLLRARFVSNRLPFRLDAANHYDLVHACRRIWKLRLKDCSLGNIERQVLGIRRHGDVPSAQIPEIWFSYLRTRDARLLPRVFYHHQMDILSLVTLTARVAQCLSHPVGDALEYAEDRLSLVRLHYRQKRFAEAAAHADRLLELETDPDLRRYAFELLARACKRLEDWDRMADVWGLMLREFPSELLPRLELAKHHEHRSKNLAEAIRLCEEAMEMLDTPSVVSPLSDFDDLQARDFLYRLDRLRGKQAKRASKGPRSSRDDVV